MKQLYKAKIASGLEYECIGDQELELRVGVHVIVKCERYLDYATISECIEGAIEDVEAFERKRAQENKGRHIEGQRIPQIMRVATEEDELQARDNERQAHVAHNQTMERIKAHNLEMKLIFTHYAFDRKLIIFQFSADGRIDFRELLRDLSGLLKVRVELRQVGVRDEASILGGIGTCGRPFCCSSFLPSFNSINVKMAKQQGLSLNPQNISGCCGRLKCCLQYEAETYKELLAEQKLKQHSQQQPSQAVENDEADASMFEDEGTVVATKVVAKQEAGRGGESEGNGGSRRPQQRQSGERRERQGKGQNQNQNQGQNQNSGQGKNRQGGHNQQHNPPKRPLPPAGAEGGVDGSQPVGKGEDAQRGGNGGKGRNNEGRRNKERRGNGERRHNDQNGGGGERGSRNGGQGGNPNNNSSASTSSPAPSAGNDQRGGSSPAGGGSIGEFGC